jgi:hypothetical protein
MGVATLDGNVIYRTWDGQRLFYALKELENYVKKKLHVLRTDQTFLSGNGCEEWFNTGMGNSKLLEGQFLEN